MKHEMVVLNEQGDGRLSWNPDDALSVEQAMRVFNELIDEGYRGAKMASAETGTMIDKFDPSAESIVMVPRIHAG